MRIRYGAVIPLPLDEAFDFVTNPENWTRFFKNMESAEALDGWGAPGGKARMVNKVLGQEVVTDLELVEWDCPHRFRYIAHNQGRRDAISGAVINDRVFQAVPGGTRLIGTTTTDRESRAAIQALKDAAMLLASRRMYHRGMKELPAQAAQWARSGR